jgi:hypothetical protein
MSFILGALSVKLICFSISRAEGVCREGYNNFDFFDKMEHPRPEIDVVRHIYKNMFSFLSRFILFWLKSHHKMANLMLT